VRGVSDVLVPDIGIKNARYNVEKLQTVALSVSCLCHYRPKHFQKEIVESSLPALASRPESTASCAQSREYTLPTCPRRIAMGAPLVRSKTRTRLSQPPTAIKRPSSPNSPLRLLRHEVIDARFHHGYTTLLGFWHFGYFKRIPCHSCYGHHRQILGL
jgi:hypothetical protein